MAGLRSTGAGPCFLSGECGKTAGVHPSRAHPALEAGGLDVFATARAKGFPSGTVRDESHDQKHHELALVD